MDPTINAGILSMMTLLGVAAIAVIYGRVKTWFSKKKKDQNVKV
jgi:hypothetical protein